MRVLHPSGQRFAFAVCVSLALLLSAPLRAQRLAVEGERGMVVSVHHLASAAGAEILQRGGNAVDAAVATGLALVTVYPWAGALGGGGFMLVRMADGRQVAVDYRETAPASATRDMYLGPNGEVVKGASTVGWRASGIPGTVAGFALAMEKYGSGKVSWTDVCEPARRLAAEGHVVSAFNASRQRVVAKKLEQFPESKRIYLNDGAYWKTGDIFRQPDLAATFARLQKNGPRDFYEGETARLIADAMSKHGGTITLADLKGYRPAERPPVRGTYRGHEIITMPPPSSGGIVLLQMLGMLEPYDVAALGHISSAKYHLFIEVMRRAFRDRAEYMADPDFVKVPVAELLDRDYLKRRMSDFSPDKATPSAAVQPGLGALKLSQHPAHGAELGREATETTHYSVVDAAGNAVANTFTLNGGYGSGVTIPGTGILMNNEMDDFTAKPGTPNMFKLIQGEANAIAPGKRPLSAMTPTVVLKDGKLVLVTGSPGGPTIINTVLCVITNVIDHRMPVAQAVDAPRIHHQWMPDVVGHEPYSLARDVSDALTAKGHTFEVKSLYADGASTPLLELYQGDAETIFVDPKTNVRYGAADSRKPDSRAVGY
jgi:gamma-glutamyltranspeptidase / glutathione hydrolase